MGSKMRSINTKRNKKKSGNGRKGDKGNYGSINLLKDPFNVMPMTRRGQSKRDKKRAEREKKLLAKKSVVSQRSVKHKLKQDSCKSIKKKKKKKVDREKEAWMEAAAAEEKALGNFCRRKNQKKNSETPMKEKKAKLKLQREHIKTKGGRRKSSVLRIPSQKQYLDKTKHMAVPWLPQTASATSSSCSPPPLHSVRDQAMQQLDNELLSFASYVKLSPMEHRARSYLVSHVSQMCTDLFQDSSLQQVQVMPFGSFATPEICTFVSDVDLAIWGVVPPQTSSFPSYTGQHMYFNVDDHNEEEDVDKKLLENTTSDSESSLPRLTQSSYQRTMQAIHEAQQSCSLQQQLPAEKENDDDEKQLKPPKRKKSKFSMEKLEKIQKWKDALNQTPSDNDITTTTSTKSVQLDKNVHQNGNIEEEEEYHCKTESDKSPSCLFVIDRVGDFITNAHDDTEQTTTATNDNTEQITTESTNGVSPKTENKGDINKSKHYADDIETRGDEEKEEGKGIFFILDRDATKQVLDESNGDNQENDKECSTMQTTKECVVVDDDSNSHIAAASSRPDEETDNDVTVHDPANTSNTAKNNKQEEDDDDDSADKMESYDEQKSDADTTAAARHQFCENTSSDDEDSCNSYTNNLERFLNYDDNDDYEFEVSCIVPNSEQEDFETRQQSSSYSTQSGNRNRKYSCCSSISSSQLPPPTPVTPTSMGPTGKTRKKVITALRSLGKKVWKSPLAHTVEVRRHARVPIINIATRFGFEGDIALGGHNGTDTSHYAAGQVQRHHSFASIVLLLKILLRQTDLDKPFTGGLGSYKLYVLVAYHMEQHIALGGSDRPSDVLLNFFYRFGDITGIIDCSVTVHEDATTNLTQDVTLTTDGGGSADLQPVFKIDQCVKLFGLCFQRLCTQLKSFEEEVMTLDGRKEGELPMMSFLMCIIDSELLQRERENYHNKCTLVNKLPSSDNVGDGTGHIASVIGTNSYDAIENSNHKRKAAHSSFVKFKNKKNQNNGEGSIQVNRRKIRNTFHSPKVGNDGDDIFTRKEEEKLMAGYGMKRGPRGSLIPLNRPDLDARKCAEKNSEHVLFTRARKNRKNKRKQARDVALQEFARKNSL